MAPSCGVWFRSSPPSSVSQQDLPCFLNESMIISLCLMSLYLATRKERWLPHLSNRFLSDIFLRENLDLQPLVCLSSCLFCLHSQAMANVSPPRRLFLPSSCCWSMVVGYPYLCKAHGGISPSVLTSKLTVHAANTLACSSSKPG